MFRPNLYIDEPSSGLSRRSVLRGVAWAAPIIVVATASPASAASGDIQIISGGDMEIRFDNFTVYKVWAPWPNDWGGVEGNLKIDREDDDPALNPFALTQLTVDISFEHKLFLTGAKEEVVLQGSSAGWTVQSVSIGETFTVYTFLWVGSMEQWGNTGMLKYRIPTTIVSSMANIGPFTVTGVANSPQIRDAVTGQASVS